MPSKRTKQDVLDELDRARQEAETQHELYGCVLPYTVKRVIDLEGEADAL